MRYFVELLTIFITLVTSGAVVQAQQPKKAPRIGFLSGGFPTTNAARHEAFRQGLRELGYVEGKNIVVKYRYADVKADRERELAAELARLKVDVIVTAAPSVTQNHLPAGSENQRVYTPLADKPIYGDQTLADGIDSEEQAFKSHGAEQRRTVGRNKTWRRDFIAVQGQPSFSHGPYVSLPACDYDALRASGLKLEPFRQRSGHHAKRSAGVHQKLNFFDMSGWAGQMSFDVEQSHRKCLAKTVLL